MPRACGKTSTHLLPDPFLSTDQCPCEFTWLVATNLPATPTNKLQQLFEEPCLSSRSARCTTCSNVNKLNRPRSFVRASWRCGSEFAVGAHRKCRYVYLKGRQDQHNHQVTKGLRQATWAYLSRSTKKHIYIYMYGSISSSYFRETRVN